MEILASHPGAWKAKGNILLPSSIPDGWLLIWCSVSSRILNPRGQDILPERHGTWRELKWLVGLSLLNNQGGVDTKQTIGVKKWKIDG